MLADHQVEAVRRAVAAIDAFGGVILADEVGLGKSFVAAAVAKRFAGEIDLIVPASLVTQWQRTLRQFQVEATIETHDAWAHSFRIADPAVPRLVIVDEAHAFRNPATQRYDALARRTLAARVLLVTAMPLCNSAQDLHALLALIVRDDVLLDRGVPSIDLAFETLDGEAIEHLLGHLLIRRDRSVLPERLQFGSLERRVIHHAVPAAPIDALEFPLTGSAPLLRRFLWRRLESSEAALIESIKRQLRFYERVIESGRPLTKRDYRQAFAHEEDSGAFQQVLFWDVWAPSAALDVAAIREEMQKLDAVRSFAESNASNKLDLLRGTLTGEPALIFTGSAATARFLATALQCGLATARDGRGAIDAFQRGTIDLLVTTDFASEGLNLQRAAAVIHYDIPWNPAKLDQRNGRAHRIGQTRESVTAIYFLPEGDPTKIVATIASKNRLRRSVLKRSSESPTLSASTLRPRVTAGAAVVKFPVALPEALDRRHKAGLERLVAALSHDVIDRRRLADLLA
ncbi:MAG TPA: DEAD/DEAH box helicase, partial [Thermoanaerobaculia bacterium]